MLFAKYQLDFPEKRHISVDINGLREENVALFLVGFPSGQRDQTVNLTRKLRWFKSTPHHQFVEACECCLSARELALIVRDYRLVGVSWPNQHVGSKLNWSLYSV